jgi:hypothetical protein
MASEVGIRFTNLDEIKAKIEEKKVAVAEVNLEIAEACALVVVASVKKHFRPRQSGDMVISKRTGNPWYRSTPPFQPVPPDPTSRSGSLVAHISFEVKGGDGAAAATIGPTILHGKYVAMGSKPPGTGSPQSGVGRGHNRRPFPYLSKGLEDAEGEIRDIYQERWAAAIED